MKYWKKKERNKNEKLKKLFLAVVKKNVQDTARVAQLSHLDTGYNCLST